MGAKRNRAWVLAALSVTGALADRSAVGVTYTWTGASGYQNMSNAGNWVGGTVPVSSAGNSTIVFNAATGYTYALQDIASPLVTQSVQTVPSYNTFTVQGSPIQFNNLGAAPTILANGGMSFYNDLAFNAATTYNSPGGYYQQIYGGTTGSLTLIGGSQFAIYGTSTSTLTSLVTSSTLTLQRTGPVVNGTFETDAATVNLYNPNQFTTATNVVIGTLATPGGYVAGYGSQQLNNLTMVGGTYFAQSANVTTVGGTIACNGGSSQIGQYYDSLAFGGTQHVISVAAPVNPTDGLSLLATITNGSYNKTGAGLLSFSSNATYAYTGVNLISAGTVRGLADAVGPNVLDNAALQLSGGTVSGTISGSGSVLIQGYVTYTGTVNNTGGTTVDQYGNLTGTTSTLVNPIVGIGGGSATVTFDQPGNGAYAQNLSGGLSVLKVGTGVVTLSGTNSYNNGTMVSVGGLNVTNSNSIGTGLLTFQNNTTAVSFQSTGTVSLANPVLLQSNLNLIGTGNITFTDTTAKQMSYVLVQSGTGTVDFAGKFTLNTSGSINVSSGTLALGDPSVVSGFTAQGPVIVNGGTLLLRSLNFVTLPDVTLNTGTLSVPNGYAIPLGAALQGTGTVSGRVASANGSTILAAGALTMGDSTNPAGANLDGELYTKQYTVTLNDSNQAVLGSLSKLGNGPGQPGTLQSVTGFVLNFGRNITGNGNVVSNNTLATDVIINGDVNGLSFSNPINFTGYVKGVGTFNNTTFSGTFSPGFSPTLMTVGTIGFGPTNDLIMELGGTLRGGQYDAIDSTGTLYLNGTMDVMLINGFNPSLGDSFDLFNGGMSGTFTTVNYPALSTGLAWDGSQLYTTGVIQVVSGVPEPTTLAWAAGLVLLGRRRRK